MVLMLTEQMSDLTAVTLPEQCLGENIKKWSKQSDIHRNEWTGYKERLRA